MFKPQQSTPPEESMAQAESYPTLTEVAPERGARATDADNLDRGFGVCRCGVAQPKSP